MDQSTIGILVSGIGILLFLIVGILTMKKQSNQAMKLGIAVGFLGLLGGAAITLGGMKFAGYSFYQLDTEGGPDAGEEEAGGGGGGGGGGRGGGGGGGGRGGFQPSPSRDLVTMIKKLELVTRGSLQIKLDEEKSASLKALLDGIKAAPVIEDTDAEDMLSELKGKLSEQQLEALETFSLPRTRGSRGGGGGEEGPTNPFNEEANATALTELSGRL